MGGIYTEAFLHELEMGLRGTVGAWGLSPETKVSLLNISENATYRADDPNAAAPVILRVHRPNYHTRAEIVSELAWIDALRAEQVAPIPAILDLVEGGRIAGMSVSGETRDVIAFEFMAGAEPSPGDDLTEGFRRLGAISASLHEHAKRWNRPSAFERKTWNFDTTVGATPHWGDWRAALGLTRAGTAVLERTCDVLERRLAAFGTGPDRFGLIHADLRLANLLIEGRPDWAHRLRRLRLWLVRLRLRCRDQLLRDGPVDPGPAGCVVQGIPGGRRSRSRGGGGTVDIHHAAPPATDGMDRQSFRNSTAQEMGTAFTDGTIEIAERYLSERG